MKRLFALIAICALGFIPAAFIAPAPASAQSLAAYSVGTTPLTPGGRLTLTAGTPVMTADVANAGVLYYVPSASSLYPIYNGTTWTEYYLTSLSTTFAAANVVSTKIYDVFATLQNGAPALCVGTAWTNGTTRAMGLTLVNGILTNGAAFVSGTNGCFDNTTGYSIGQYQGTYLGTIYANGTAQVTWNIAPAAAAHGSANFLGVFNAYNRVHVTTRELSSTTSNTYATNTWHPDDGTGQTLNVVTYIDGLGVSHVNARQQGYVTPTNSDVCQYGINLNSTSATPAIIGAVTAPATAFAAPINAIASFTPTLGLNVVNAMENSLSAATCTFNATAAFHALIVDLDL